MLTSSLVYSLCSLPQADSFILKCLFGPKLLLMSSLAVLEVFKKSVKLLPFLFVLFSKARGSSL